MAECTQECYSSCIVLSWDLLPSISHVSREAKLSLIACVSTSSDLRLQERGLQLWLGDVAMQIQEVVYSILLNVQKQLLVLPPARSL